jgi:hypothetical protein
VTSPEFASLLSALTFLSFQPGSNPIRLALGSIPILSLIGWTVALYLHALRRDSAQATLRNAVLQAAALMGLWTVAGTEGLSAFNGLRFNPILAWWLIALVSALMCAIRNFQFVRQRIDLRSYIRLPTLAEAAIGLPFVVILLLAFTSAFFNPPNNYDSYSYHLPRQIFWLQHANVRHYPTNNLRQDMMAPFSEFVGVQFMALSNSDRWANLVQFGALCITFCAVSLMTERLGGNRSVQLLACLILLVSPVVFMEASNTKNDLVVAMWIAIATWQLIRILDGAPVHWLDALLLGAALGCGADTKGTGPLFVIPIVVVLCITMLRRFSMPRFKTLAFIGVVALAINLPQFSRNYRAFGHIDGPTPAHGGYPLYNESHGANVVVSNIVRLLAWHAAIGYQPFNDAMYRDVVWLHAHVLGLGINDKRTTTPFSSYDGLIFRGDDEDRAGSPAHILLLCLLPIALFIARRRIYMPYALLLCGIAVAGFVIFNWLVKWQEWHSRYFIPQTALFAPVLAVAFTGRARIAVALLLAWALAASLIPTIRVNPRQLFGPPSLFYRSDLERRFTYFGHNPEFEDFAKLVATRKMQWVGFATNGDFPDYAFMYVTKRQMHRMPNFEYVNPHVKIAGYPPRRADVIIADVRLQTLLDKQTGVRYRLYAHNSFFNVLLPEGDPAL